MPSVIFFGEPMNGTADGELIVDVPGGDGPDSTINGNGGDDLILGDSDHLHLNYLSATNTSLGAAQNIDIGSWSTSANPIIGVAGPHTSIYIEPGAGEQRFFEVTVGAGETITLDVDFTHGTGWGGTDTIIDILAGDGTVLATNDDNAGDFGSVGNFDSRLSFFAAAGGTYYIRVREFGSGDGNTFEGDEQVFLNVSVTNHAASSDPIEAGNDTISGGFGDDTIFGMLGNDTVHGDEGNDIIVSTGFGSYYGDDGNDTIYSGNGTPELLDGGAGVDLLDTTSWAFDYTVDLATGTTNWAGESFINFENLRAGAGNDTLSGTSGDNNIRGGAGNDTIFGLDGNDSLLGDAGDDTLDGGAGDDTLNGGDGDDTLTGGSGVDTLNGDGGNDTITSDGDGGTYNGGDGDDLMFSGIGGETMDGGAGIDTINHTVWNGTYIIDLTTGSSNFAGELYTNFENAILGNGSDSVTGTSGANIIDGGGGNDTLMGLGGNDTLNGGTGADTMSGGTGHDVYYVDDAGDAVNELAGEGTDRVHSTVNHTLADDVEDLTLEGGALIGTGNARPNVIKGNAGANTLSGLGNSDDLYGYGGDDTLLGGGAHDDLFGGNGADTLQGDEGNDRLYGQGGNDFVNGGAGNDNVFGGAGNDNLQGGNGADIINGHGGDDLIVGGPGIDILTGGAGADRFLFNPGHLGGSLSSTDRIKDFNHAQGDSIDLHNLDANTNAGGNQAFTWIGGAAFSGAAGQLRYEIAGNTTTVYGDTDGDGTADFALWLTGQLGLVAGDFVL